MRSARPLALLSACALLRLGLADPADSVLDSAIALDEECASAGDGSGKCALSALQLRAVATANASNAGQDPDPDDPVPSGKCNDTTALCPDDYKCVTTADGTWSQCVPTEQKYFRRQCVKWTAAVRWAAIHTMGFNCEDAMCTSQAWCVDGYKCAAQPDGKWAQCIQCSSDTFRYNCYSWTTQFQEAAYRACGHKCRAPPCDRVGSSRKCSHDISG
mmetsp:Transcript_150/g.387  ORF Transcript_150/g.387 Transcript_150/m.387 type:complete len:216 (-) Transcript_150:40-687(-)